MNEKDPLRSGTIGDLLASLSWLEALSDHYLFGFSQLWLPTVQEVLHADWQEVWHSPHPPFFTVFCKFFVFRVLICSITLSSLCNYILGIVYHISFHFKSFFLRQHSTQCSTACAHKKCCNCMSCTHIPAAFCHNRDSQQ